ncbi:hypothetical protein GGR52DRAFT_179179 [Hypoxylon sp. FL1284]|nr:hypothetical protein GGR52DRAFT_179179 [Hypoxylon sp. FL1284]
MVFCVKLLTALAAIISVGSSSLEKRGPSIVIGYRTVGQEAAKLYHDAGNTLVYSGASSDQLGPGAYISPIPEDWPLEGDQFWVCAILADSSAWNLVNKAWMPDESDDCGPLWYSQGETNRNKYLRDVGGQGFTTSNIVLLSKITGFHPEKLQILIPKAILGKKDGLKFNVQCAQQTNRQAVAEIAVYGNVDWYSWVNVKGTPQHVNP